MSSLARLSRQPRLDKLTVEGALRELLDAVQDDDLPERARSQLHAYYDRFQSARGYFLHHFASFVGLADEQFQVVRQRPMLLDLGCGVATQAHLLALRGAHVVGLDSNVLRVKAGREMTTWFARRAGADTPLDVSLHAADAFTWLEEQPAGSFDGCYAQFALAYMRPQSRLLELLDHVLRPGGRVLLREFNAGSIYNRLIARVDWLSAADYGHTVAAFGWQGGVHEYCWLLPRPLVLGPASPGWLGRLEAAALRLPAIGPATAAAMTLLFTKPSQPLA